MTETKGKIEGTAENWENGTLGTDEKYAKLSDLTLESMEKTLGLKSISIRLDASLIEDFKLISSIEGLSGYQPLMRRVLERFADCQLKDYARKIMAEKAKQAALEALDDEPPRKQA